MLDKGFIKTNKGENIELKSLEVKMIPVVKTKDGQDKTERYIGLAEFETNKNIELLDDFNIEGTYEDTESIKITGCRNIVEIEDKRYITNFNVKNVEIG